jgi:hypothetical protein
LSPTPLDNLDNQENTKAATFEKTFSPDNNSMPNEKTQDVIDYDLSKEHDLTYDAEDQDQNPYENNQQLNYVDHHQAKSSPEKARLVN